ncbi:hypothetical protein [Alkalihalobacillus sp. TS-13]|uniref:hypothetical protein n=1 Tax=Alkalihalobacillus sp. TS-13 TaxID=2842455 RepID=UPI001C86A35F|nr:hypothetical protein [Alkalihalobacillus sp. TS-13]
MVRKNDCLFGFPHPLGANGHRVAQFGFNKERFNLQIETFSIDHHDLKSLEMKFRTLIDKLVLFPLEKGAVQLAICDTE